MSVRRTLVSQLRRAAAVLTCGVLAGGGVSLVTAAPAWATTSPCADGSAPAPRSTVSCTGAGTYSLAVPVGTTSVDVDVIGGGGGAGYPARQHIGGNAAEVTGTATLPNGTAYLYVIVGDAGTGDNHGTSSGGKGSAVFALDASNALLAKLAIAGGGGGGAYNGDGGNAGSPGTTDNAQAVSGPGAAGSGATGGAGGTGNYAPGTAGGSDDPAALTVAGGGTGGAVPGGARGGGGAGGYGGGGGGGGSRGSILSSNVAGGGGGSSLASNYLGSASISVKSGTRGIQLPGLVAGDGAVGSVVMTFNGAAVPGAPTGVSADAGDQQASVSFSTPASDGGSPITSYTVTASPGGHSATCPGSPCVVTGLTNGTAYTFTVHATNTNGDSTESSASTSVTPATPPGAPTGASAVAGAGQASVSFSAPASNGGAAITGYTATSSPGGLTGTCASSPCTVSGLTNGTAYTFTVRATNPIGDSPASAASTAVSPADVPDAPVVTATPGDERITVTFTAPADQGSPITGYLVSTNGGSTWSTLPTTTGGGTVTGTVTGLANGTTYAVRVRAVNGKGNGVASITRSVTPATVPGAPSGVSATRGNASASVSFTAPSSNGGTTITSYTVTSAPGGLSATCASSPCTVTGLANGTAYTFTVHATNPVGSSAESTASSPVTPATVATAPTSVTVTGGDSSASLSFTAPGDNGGEAITGYEYSTDGSTWQPLTVSGAAPVTATITDLTNGISYPVQVRALNSVGPGTASAAVAVTPATTPGTPFALTAVRGNGQAVVSFEPPSGTGGAAITSYTVTSAPGGLTAGCAESPCTVTGLINGTAYTFTVHATNSAGDSGESNATDPIVPSTTPGVPDEVTTTAAATSITVSFIAPATGGSPITGYEISTDGGMNWVAFSPSGSPPSGTITGLTPGTDYQVAVRAFNTVGAGDPTTAEAVTTLPATVAGPTATVGTSSATVTWPQSPTSTVTGYTVYAHPGPATCTTEAITATSCVIGATAGVSYTYTVVAHSPSGDSAESAASEPITAMPPTVPAEAPSSAPTTLTTTEGKLSHVDPGQQITVVGTGFAPYSSVSIIFYSASIVLGTAVTDADGDFTKQVTVPSSLEPGSHNLVAAGVDSTGAVHMIRMLVTVKATSPAPGAGGQLPITGAPVLALAIWSGLISAVGVGLVVYAGRRPARHVKP
jgi:hypothetical protein